MLRRMYSIWVILSIILPFFVFFIPLVICIPFCRLHKAALWINYAWAWIFFKMSFIPLEIDWRFDLDKSRQYILCANHFSYLDIPAMGLIPLPFKFVGKSQLKKIPFFGLMYDGLHITVNRKSYKSRAKSLSKARKALDLGFNLGFFPEGGIRFQEYPKMVQFKDGAFRIACEKKIPIIPISFPNNHFILPDNDRFLVTRKTCKVIYHEPVSSHGSSEADIKNLKNKVASIIQHELSRG